VYNWTDSPSIVSRNWLLILEPHQRWSNGGPKYDFVKYADDPEMQSQMEAFKSLVVDPRKPFQGTIIRIPLRTTGHAKASEICDKPTTFAEVANVMRTFASDFGRSGLLFMKNVAKISISVGNDPAIEMQISNAEEVRKYVYSISLHGLSAAYVCCSHKSFINKGIQEASSGAVSPFDRSFEVQIESGPTSAKTRTHFIVHHKINNYPADEKLREWCKTQAMIPWVAVAAQAHVSTLKFVTCAY
jgi:sacsin